MENIFVNVYGVKAEKAKHRKSRKAKRLEGTYHQGEYSSNAWGWKKCNQRDLSLIAKKEKVNFKQNHLLILEEEYSDYMETYFGDSEDDYYDYYGFDCWLDSNQEHWEEPDENNIIVGDDWKKYAHFDENTLAEIAKEAKETDKYWTFDEAFAENLRQYNIGFEDGKKYVLNLLEKKGVKINLELLEN